MPILNYECDNGHQFEGHRGRDREKCPECGLRSPIIWIAPRSPHAQFKTPIVMWRYKDGSMGVAGGADSRTPKDAERIEIRSGAEYRQHVGELNRQMRDKHEKREERYMEGIAKMEKYYRSNLAWMMGQETDPIAKDIYREALEWNKDRRRSPEYRDYYSMAMEMDKSNYEG